MAPYVYLCARKSIGSVLCVVHVLLIVFLTLAHRKELDVFGIYYHYCYTALDPFLSVDLYFHFNITQENAMEAVRRLKSGSRNL